MFLFFIFFFWARNIILSSFLPVLLIVFYFRGKFQKWTILKWFLNSILSSSDGDHLRNVRIQQLRAHCLGAYLQSADQFHKFLQSLCVLHHDRLEFLWPFCIIVNCTFLFILSWTWPSTVTPLFQSYHVPDWRKNRARSERSLQPIAASDSFPSRFQYRWKQGIWPWNWIRANIHSRKKLQSSNGLMAIFKFLFGPFVFQDRFELSQNAYTAL